MASNEATPGVVIKYTWVRDDEICHEPKKAHPTDAGFDLTCSRYMQVYPNSRVLLPTNVAVELPGSMWGLILPRSSLAHEKGLLLFPGVVDIGYRGELMLSVSNLTRQVIHVDDGERIAQLLVFPHLYTQVKKVKKLADGDRGTSGFGSSGGYKKKPVA